MRNDIVCPPRQITRAMREQGQRHKGKVFWFTGLSGSGKSTLAHEAEKLLFEEGCNVLVLDGDRMRSGLCADLSFSVEARAENLRRTAHVAKLFAEQGIVCLCSLISPLVAGRKEARTIIGEDDFREIYVACPLAVCEGRDIKGFYARARQGIIKNYTGISSPYEVPEHPDLKVETGASSIEENSRSLVTFIRNEIQMVPATTPDL